MEFKSPQLLRLEHQELHSELEKITRVKGRIGEAAKEVARRLHPHFVKEEEFALPPLGLLKKLAEGQIDPEMTEVIPMTDRLKAEWEEMVQEHVGIVDALNHLAMVANEEGKPQYARYAEKLIFHAQTEEEILYPASILIGEYVKAKLQEATA